MPDTGVTRDDSGDSAEAAIGALPLAYGELFGREADLERSEALLLGGVRPVLTIVGPGGVGKTRLAMAIGDRVGRRFADGVRFVALAGERTSTSADVRIRQAMGGATGGPDQVRQWLGSREALLILDNLEQIEGAGELVAGLVPRTGGSRVLVTSRGPLHLAAEQVMRIGPLPVGFTGGTADGASPAVELFVDVATAADAGYAPDAVELAQIGELCRRLDGLPLAIRLAAQRRRLIGVPEMLRRVERDRTLLAGAGPDLEERQRTIERSIGWSLDLMTVEEQVDAHLLALPPAGFSDAGLAAVEPPVAIATLERLTDLGVVSRDGERVSMLQTVRDVVVASQPEAVAEQNRERLVVAVVRDAPRLQALGASPNALAEDANLRLVVQWLVDRGEADRLLTFIASLDYYWTQSGTAASIVGPLRWALRAAPGTETGATLRLLQLASLASALAGEPDEGVRLAREMVALAEEHGTVVDRLRALNTLGGASLYAHRTEDAYDIFGAALALEAEGADVTKVLINQAGVAVALGRDDEAIELLERADARVTAGTGTVGHPVPSMHLAEIAMRAGDQATARRHLRSALTRSVELHQRVWQLGAAFLTGDLALTAGDIEAAASIVVRTEVFLDRERMDMGVLADKRGLGRMDELRERVGLERWRQLRRANNDAGLPDVVEAALAWLGREPLVTQYGPLTTREAEIAGMIAQGHSNQEIADALFLSRRTVQTHVANMLRKLELPSRSALAAWQATTGAMITPEG